MPGEPVLQKWSNDIWSWHGIETLLEREGIVAGEWTVLVTGVSAAGCAEAAALGFSNRLYKTIIPLDCSTASIEAEARIFSVYMEPEYSHLMDFTMSSMVTFAGAPVEVPERVLTPTA
jgi:nicotinamidase-related amidase